MRKDSIAEKTRLPMAYDRKTFKDRVKEKLGGALGHFYMAHLAELNQQTRWVQHWKGEVERLVYIEFEVLLGHPLKGNWDRAKAANEVIAELRQADKSFRRTAENVIKRYCGLKRVSRELPGDFSEQFYQMVQQAMSEALEIT